jgi:hypothetical protein
VAVETDTGIDVTESGWNSVMVECGYVFDHRETQYTVYQRNDYGRGGFDLAVRQ